MEIVLDKWQQEIIDHKGHILLCTGRQVGKTMTFSIKAAKYMIKHPKSRIIVVSLTEDQAQLIIVMILNYLEENHKRLIAKGKKKPTKSRIWLTNDSMVISRPVGNTGDAIRGFTGDVLIVDEASRMPEVMWAAAKPTLLTTGGEIWMCSTPYGKEGYFYECYLNKNNKFKVFHISSEEVIRNRPISKVWTKERKEAAIKFLESEKKDMSALQYAQEYLGEFVDDLRQLFPDNLILKCMKEKRRNAILKNRIYYLGCDVARMGEDESTFEIVERIGDRLIHVENQITKKTLLTQTATHIINLDRLYNLNKIFVDDEGIGIGVFDILISNERTRRKTEALRNSKKIIDWKASRAGENSGRVKMLKEDLYMNLLALMEQGRISLLDDPEIFQSFKSVQYEFIKDKKGRNFMRIFGNYTHIVEGLIRAAWGVKQKNIKVWIRSIKI